MSTKSPEEVRNDLKSALGEDFGEAVYWLDNAITNAHVELKIFKGLFVHSPERVEVLNEASGLTAMYIQKALWDSICMSLCRLTDPKRTAGNPNLCLDSLPEFFGENEAAKEQFSSHLSQAKEASVRFRDRRNKVLAHADLGIALQVAAIEDTSYSDAKKCLEKVAACMNFVRKTFLESTMAYEFLVLGPNDERALLKRLYLGNQFEAQNSLAQKLAIKARDYQEVQRLQELSAVPDWVLSES